MPIDFSRLIQEAWERDYLEEIFASLPELNAVAFHCWGHDNPYVVMPRVEENDVLVMLSEENHNPTPSSKCRLFLRTYDGFDYGFPIPLGYMRGFPIREARPISERSLDVSFLGRRYPSRDDAIAAIKQHPYIQSLSTRISSDRVGLVEYANIMYDSKIVLSPRGVRSPECCRFFEGIMCGCVVIHARQVDNWIYRGTPTISIEPFDSANVEAIVQQVRMLMENPSRLQAMSDAALEHWRRVYAPEAVSKRIRRQLELV